MSSSPCVFFLLTPLVLPGHVTPHANDVEAGGEATGDSDVANLDQAAPLVILNQNPAQHCLGMLKLYKGYE